MKEVILTPEGHKKLQEEIEYLSTTRRQEIAERIRIAREFGDIAENAEVDELPVQLHVADPDPFETGDWLNSWYLQMQRTGADVEIYRYPGAGHLFTDPDLPDYDAASADLTWKVALGFLATL